ncbi:hypothetical protein RUM44_002968 [Polyplax serrata]|uniref:Tektin n=1 Tax=Polyplax serrata TaxID=468196 RepID=A0ABR1AXL6_POLSC
MSSLYFESLKPLQVNCTIKKWRDHSLKVRKLLEGKDGQCRDLRNESRKMRYDIGVSKTWDNYFNNIKLQNRVYEIEVLILYAESMLPQIVNEKKLILEEKFQTETLLQKCDTWLGVCIDGLSCLDKKLEDEVTRDDEATIEIRKEIQLLEDAKVKLKEECLLAWEMSCRLEDAETRIGLNLEFKEEVLAMDKRCLSIQKMDTGVSFKVDATKGPNKMLNIEDWSKTVYGLVEKGQNEIQESRKLRERMLATRGVILNEYAIQFDKTDYEMRRRVYEINREKNESQYQLLRVGELMNVTKAEYLRLDEFLTEVKNDLRCVETRCSDRYFRPSVDATMDPPFLGLNKEATQLQSNVEAIDNHLDVLKSFYNQLEADSHKLFLESEAKNKALQVQVQALDIRIAGRFDPKGVYAYNPDILMSRMLTQMPPPFSLYSSKC